MAKTNKELAVEMACAMISSHGIMSSNPNVKKITPIDHKTVIDTVKYYLDELNKIDAESTNR